MVCMGALFRKDLGARRPPVGSANLGHAADALAAAVEAPGRVTAFDGRQVRAARGEVGRHVRDARGANRGLVGADQDFEVRCAVHEYWYRTRARLTPTQ